MFGTGPPKFKTKANKVIDKEEFPDLGDAPLPKDKTSKKTETKTDSAPKFSGQNRFEGLGSAEQPKQSVHAKVEKDEHKEHKNTDDRKPKDRPPIKHKQEKDEFFGNFRNANKDIKTKEPEASKEVEKEKGNYIKNSIQKWYILEAETDDKPRFQFFNAKKDAHTMAKAQEEAQKTKPEFDKQIELERKQKEEADKKREEYYQNKKKDNKPKNEDKFERFNKDDKKDKFDKSDKAHKIEPKREKDKPAKPKKEKIVKEAVDLKGVDEWGSGKLEDIL